MKFTTDKTARRSIIQSFFAMIAAAGAGLFNAVHAQTNQAGSPAKPPAGQANNRGPLFSGTVTHGGLVYVAGKGEHTPGDIKAHTTAVLDKIEEDLKKAGSSMDKVLKVNVYLNDLKDYVGMNEAYRGRFGGTLPVRTTVACAGGIPGDSLVEIDCIAYV
ncbi:MAG TPA: RidA family protein [Vicinamibacterales bacterium]|nr:RidA family protein [Vicinamibacterales bacterium]